MMNARVLIVDDDRAMCELLQRQLRGWGFAPEWRTDAAEALQLLLREDFDAVVSDVKMPGMDGAEFCQRLAASRPGLPVVLITAFGSIANAIAAIRAGAYDFIPKPFDVEVLALALERAVQHRALTAEVRRLRDVAARAGAFDEQIVGASPAMTRLYELLARVADSEASLLVVGETGTGKELVARAVHRRSARHGGPFVAVNCAALPEQLLESELFGHERGAFTDAKHARPGIFQQAHRGTVFLDEIGELPLALQPKLLRALQERCVRPLGSTVEVPFEARVIAATNRDLEADVEQQRFRPDLLYRINVVQIDVPPLRARGNDVLLLAQRFIDELAPRAGREVRGLTGAAAQKLLGYGWPGNVRELRNCIERALALTQHEQLVVDDLPERIRDFRSSQIVAGDDPSELVPLAEVERRYILRVLDALGGNKLQAARVLGLDRRTLYRKLEQYEAAARRGRA